MTGDPNSYSDSLRALSFPDGSMGPKVEAACRFVEATGKRAVIGRLENAIELFAGTQGTTVVQDVEEADLRQQSAAMPGKGGKAAMATDAQNDMSVERVVHQVQGSSRGTPLPIPSSWVREADSRVSASARCLGTARPRHRVRRSWSVSSESASMVLNPAWP